LLTRSATVDWDIVRYPDAGHWFNCDQRPSYHEASAKDAWTRALSFLDTHLP
jgi:carboxymethylenebutenolidase